MMTRKQNKETQKSIIKILDDSYEAKRKKIISCIQRYFELENSYFWLPEELKSNKHLIQERQARREKLVESYYEGEKAFLNLFQELNTRKKNDPSFHPSIKRTEKDFIKWFITVLDIYR